MTEVEYLAFVPLLFYGIALSELLGLYKQMLDRESFYLPFALTIAVFTELAVWNVYGYYFHIEKLSTVDYIGYWSFLVQPIILTLTVNSLASDSNCADTKLHFESRMRVTYSLMALFLLSHFADATQTEQNHLLRGIGVALCLVVAVTRRTDIIYWLAVIWFISFITRILRT